MLCWNNCIHHYSFISGSLHWPWLFWKILGDSYLYISVMVNGHYIHFYKKKYNKLTPLLSIHLFRSPMQASVNEGNNLLCYHRLPWNRPTLIKISPISLFIYHETGLFWSARLFQSYTNFITVIAQRTKIIKLNHLCLYDTQADHISIVF